ncbi:DJ-1 family glyoxalase III [Corallincola holothuriorum]|uniref:DJ-1 family glyoxalase III n=1 Tax=Corallincola holothuriorum TaxID=2282215 RepID=UPI0018F253A7|nr:DJ-1 family glyoxalase III [Corallincola holothuriorum]
MTIKVLVPIADGSEELEAVTMIDLLRRAGIDVTVASCTTDGGLEICASRGVKLVADHHISTLTDERYAMIALPGGMPGAELLRDSAPLLTLLTQQQGNGWIAAICAAPAVVLHSHGLIKGSATCHPAFQAQLPAANLMSDQPVVIDHDNRLVTSQGPGTAMTFALTLIEILAGADKRKLTAAPLCLAIE